jgi:UDP-2,3-diacylglucosamine pyrophosphatase LpxH
MYESGADGVDSGSVALNHAETFLSSKELKDDKKVPKTYIIVSDVHLGSSQCCRKEFEQFLEWIAYSKSRRSMVVQTENGSCKLTPPHTVILLGDILELWAPRDNEHSNVIQDSVRIFRKLIDLDCNKIYVLGNHDAMLCGGHEPEDHDLGDPKSPKTRLHPLIHFTCGNGTQFHVVPRHYPHHAETKEKQPIFIGARKYLFVHGHQFDPEFQRAGSLVEFVPLIAGLAAAFDVYPWIGKVCFASSLAFLALIVGSVFQVVPVDPLILSVLLILVGYPGFSWFITKEMKNVWEFKQMLAAALNRSDSSKKGSPSWPWPWPKRSEMRYKRICEYINDTKYFDAEKENSKPDTFVFGHTHVPEICDPMFVGAGAARIERRFVNCGSWLRPSQHQNNKALLYNTFAYIDDNGPLLFQWCGDKVPLEQKARQILPKDCERD